MVGLFSSLFAQPVRGIAPPEWSKNCSIYEVNLRQYTPGGTIKEFMTHLPRLKAMGVGILWLMPINPIGEVNRKGTLGSYYSVKDYYGLNPELGTKADFAELVKTVHKMGMHLIIDWVANHTAWDNELAKTNPEYFRKDSAGHFAPPVPDWKDVIALNYENKDLWNYMAGALEYWIKEFDIDGYRCDVAGMVPTPFWQYTRPRLEKVKNVFMLAEWEDPKLHENAFDMTYSWTMMKLMIDVAQAKAKPFAIIDSIKSDLKSFPKTAYRMRFTTNHDENSWNGTSTERFGKAVDAANVIAATMPGMFLVYSGQEAGEKKRLDFFERDPIVWDEHPNAALFTKLIALKKQNKSLWNGKYGGEFIPLTDSATGLIGFQRRMAGNSVVVFANMTDKEQTASINNSSLKGTLKNYFNGQKKSNKGRLDVSLKPYEYQVWVKE